MLPVSTRASYSTRVVLLSTWLFAMTAHSTSDGSSVFTSMSKLTCESAWPGQRCGILWHRWQLARCIPDGRNGHGLRLPCHAPCRNGQGQPQKKIAQRPVKMRTPLQKVNQRLHGGTGHTTNRSWHRKDTLKLSQAMLPDSRRRGDHKQVQWFCHHLSTRTGNNRASRRKNRSSLPRATNHASLEGLSGTDDGSSEQPGRNKTQSH